MTVGHPYVNDTLIIIDIQAPNQFEILTCVRETFEFMPGWIFCSNVQASPTDARFYVFNLTLHTFEWWRTNDTLSDTMDEDEVAIKDLADISHLLEFVWVNGETLREKEDLNAAFNEFFGHTPATAEEKKRKKKNEISAHKINVEKLEKKLKEFQTKPDFNPMMFIEEMDYPKASVFYKDLAKDDLTPEQYDTYYHKALHATCEGELIGLYNKTAGLHGPRATKLGHFINQKLKNLKYPPKTSWATEEEKYYLHSQQQQQTLYGKLASDVAAEIDKEVLAKIMVEYEKYTKESQAKKTQMWYSEAAQKQKWAGMKFSSIPGAEGLMVKPSPPYPYQQQWGKYFPEDSMDY